MVFGVTMTMTGLMGSWGAKIDSCVLCTYFQVEQSTFGEFTQAALTVYARKVNLEPTVRVEFGRRFSMIEAESGSHWQEVTPPGLATRIKRLQEKLFPPLTPPLSVGESKETRIEVPSSLNRASVTRGVGGSVLGLLTAKDELPENVTRYSADDGPLRVKLISYIPTVGIPESAMEKLWDGELEAKETDGGKIKVSVEESGLGNFLFKTLITKVTESLGK